MRLSCSELLPNILLTLVCNGLSAAVHTWKGGPQNKASELCDPGAGPALDANIHGYSRANGCYSHAESIHVGTQKSHRWLKSQSGHNV